MTTSTSVIELNNFSRVDGDQALSNEKHAQTFNELERKADNFVGDGQHLEAVEEVQRWNKPRANIFRLGAAFWTFIILGANDAAVGLETYYHASYTVVSLLFLSPLCGYALSAFSNDKIHHHFGQRGIAIICASCHLISYTAASLHPPFPALIVIYIFSGFGGGLADAGWNAWVANMANVNEIMGFLHAFYGLGATLSPLIATSLITKAHLPWYTFYYLMIGFSGLELVWSSLAFWKQDGKAFRASHPRPTEKSGPPFKEALLSLPAARTTWILTVFLFIYMGVEVALGGWIVEFMLRVRHASPFASGMAGTGFWLGMTIGRVVLGFVTPRIGERLSVMIYIPIAMGLELVFWLVPQFHVSAVAVALVGFFIGPLFPAAVVESMKLLPRHLHVFAIGFAAACGGGGASAFPFAVGAIAQNSDKGVQVLQPIALALLSTLFILWLCLPKVQKKDE
ncbi:MFS general substrate transporter [Microthyrium microscopicum]|uniref:MFS general substrate transporter n=1 Tax=Microthyrium microscopicum TaxID=703497 RepID=A0A6A6UA92_9PEZI|nr:MFS general substrate transporter [Microthyrium microscopicum]